MVEALIFAVEKKRLIKINLGVLENRYSLIQWLIIINKKTIRKVCPRYSHGMPKKCWGFTLWKSAP